MPVPWSSTPVSNRRTAAHDFTALAYDAAHFFTAAPVFRHFAPFDLSLASTSRLEAAISTLYGAGPRLNPAQLDVARIPFRNEQLAAALASYRALADHDGLDPDQVLADLLHLHHARMIGVDIASERHCLRLARATSQAQIARGVS